MKDKMKPDTAIIRTYLTRQDAEFYKMILDASGLDSFIRADDAGGFRPFQTPLSGVRLVIRAEDAERANDILTEAEKNTEPSE